MSAGQTMRPKSNATLTLCRSIRQVDGGFIVEARFPYATDIPYGEVICLTLEDVFALLKKCAILEAESRP